MMAELASAFARYHRGLGKMPLRWKPWLLALLAANMIAPLFFLGRVEARLVLGVAVLQGALMVWLTAVTGFSRLVSLGHVFWIPMIVFLWSRLDQLPTDSPLGIWVRAVLILDAGSLLLDVSNVVRYARGEREELVVGLSRESEPA